MGVIQRCVHSRSLYVLAGICSSVLLLNVYWFTQSIEPWQQPSTPRANRATPEKILKRIRPFLLRSFNATSGRILLRGISDRAFAQRLTGSRLEVGHVLRSGFETFPLLPCTLDAELLNVSAPLNGSFFVASVLRDAEERMPNLIVQLSRLALVLPKGKLFISIYESDSQDATPQWLMVFKAILDLIRCPHQIVIFGGVRQRETETRTQFMARLRNAALHPLRSYPEAAFSHVVMLDDVFFCAQQIVRLASLGVDLACGLDFEEAPPRRSWFSSSRPQPPLLVVHDVWSAIDITGRHFQTLPPFVRDAYGRDLLYKSQPFPVHSCASGLRVIRAAPFFSGVSYRGRPWGRCPASENVILAQDLIRAGFSKIVVEPGVKLGHTFREAAHVQQSDCNGGLRFIPAKKRDSRILFAKHPSTYDCCERNEESGRRRFKNCERGTFP